ncbi:hypothetical protein ACEPPN_000704 [Leptodophora sp. 'Broadleaf-Isolate-01']
MQGANNGTSRSRKKSKYLLKQRLIKSSGNETATESAETLDAPSTDTPPIGIPPTDTPPARTSPVDTPPADIPPTGIPPADTPPADTPPAETPSNATPPTTRPPPAHPARLPLGPLMNPPPTRCTIDALAKIDPAVFARLMTCAAVNWVESNRATTRAALYCITSELVELTGDFKDASDLDSIIKEIEKDDAKGSKDRQRKLWKETYYWPAIQ